MRVLALSDTTIRSLKPGDPRGRLSDAGGLYLLPWVKGGAHGWRLDYTIEGCRKTISLGTYPETGLKLAREKAAEARALVAAGIDPSKQRKAQRAAQARAREAVALRAAGKALPGSFEHLAREWFQIRQRELAPSYAVKVIARLENDVFPWIGRHPIGDITAPMVLDMLRKLEFRSVVETEHRILILCNQVFRYAVATGRITSNPARDLRDALPSTVVRHFPAITTPERLGELLRACAGYRGSHVARAALALAPMLLLRPGELRKAAWSEIDLDAALWTIPAERMKGTRKEKADSKPHLVALPSQAVDILRDLRVFTGPDGLVFRGERFHDRPMSENTINAALRTMGFSGDEVVAHGFRATARTLLAERLGFPMHVIEAQLAHTVRDTNGRAYNRTEWLAERKAMLQEWADYLDLLRAGGAVLQMPNQRRAKPA